MLEIAVSRGANRVEVTDVVGKSLAEVRPPFDDAGIRIEVTEETSETAAKGIIIRQDPGPGVVVTGKDTVRFVVSKGADPRPVPQVAGLQPVGAGYELGKAGLTVGTSATVERSVGRRRCRRRHRSAGRHTGGEGPGGQSRRFGRTGPGPGARGPQPARRCRGGGGASGRTGPQPRHARRAAPIVINQDPAPATPLAPGLAVTLTARAAVGHDDDHDRTTHDRAARDRAAGTGRPEARVADVETRPTDPSQEESDRATVRGATPPAQRPSNPRRFRPYGDPETLDVGSHPRATLIGLVAVVVLFLFASFALGRLISEDENDAAVPRVTLPRYDNRPAADAQRSLEGMGMLVAIEYQGNEVLPPGTVFAQRPVAGAKVEEGDEVTLVVSSGPVGVAVPAVTGVPVAQAQALLTALGLTPEVRPTSHETVRPGEVIGSSPAAGTDAQPGSTVAILVSTGPAPRTVPAVVDQPGATGAAEIARAGLGIGPVTERHVEGTRARSDHRDGPGTGHAGAP